MKLLLGDLEVVAAFEATVAAPNDEALADAVMAIAGESDFESRMRSATGPSGFARFLDLDHGAWLSVMALRAKARAYVLGNSFIALTMLWHHVGAGLNPPIRRMISESESNGKTRFAYDLPSLAHGPARQHRGGRRCQGLGHAAPDASTQTRSTKCRDQTSNVPALRFSSRPRCVGRT